MNQKFYFQSKEEKSKLLKIWEKPIKSFQTPKVAWALGVKKLKQIVFSIKIANKKYQKN